jgi:hypothetical protein
MFTSSACPSSNSDLKTLFSRVPPRCIIVLDGAEDASSQPREGTDFLSALLDTINSAGDGYVITMTTRHIDLVDINALMGPGRVALTAEFGVADKEMIAGLFRSAYNGHQAAGLLVLKDWR